jgi:ankyrin repeat protein
VRAALISGIAQIAGPAPEVRNRDATIQQKLQKAMTKRFVVATLVALILCSACSRLLEAKMGKLNADLRLAACDGDIKKVENALQRGANINAKDDQGSSALIDAEACGYHDRLTRSRVQLIELLLAKGAEVNHQDDQGHTALMYAARNGDTQAVNSLLRNGATVNLADKDGETALIKAAATSCNEETVTALLSAGADLNARDQKGRNALDTFRSSYACPDSKVGDLLINAAANQRQ